ncbi:MAG: peptidase [Alphaproteobacteria bacterium]|nr:MAG: peptidase [Alphaproteobacteria bacterium]
MKANTLKIWSAVHKWTSLVCTSFLLMLCLTGLPLIFHHEIDTALNPDIWQPANPDGAHLSLDAILDIALKARPGEVPLYMSFDIERPVINVTSGPTPDSAVQNMHFASFDMTSGALVPPANRGAGVMDFILQLHTDMFLGLPGMLFLGGMGILFLIAIISGVVLYAPFMRKLPFGKVRRTQSSRLKWLDYHNLLGIVTVAWVSVVGVTGVINTLESPIIDTWRATGLKDLIAENQGQSELVQRASLSLAVNEAMSLAPEMQLQFVAFPGSDFSTNRHYAIFLHGNTPLTKEIITPVLVDAQSGHVAGLREMPWYVKGLLLSRPLHFGDYGGLFLKALWAMLDVLTIVILGSGLYLWVKKSRKFREQVKRGVSV